MWGYGLDRGGSGQGLLAGTCECGYEPSGSIKCGEYLDQLQTGQLLKKDSAPWSVEHGVYLKTDMYQDMNWIHLAHEPPGSVQGEEVDEQLPVSQEAPRSMEILEVVTKPYMRFSKCRDAIMFMQMDWHDIVQCIHCPTQHHIVETTQCCTWIFCIHQNQSTRYVAMEDVGLVVEVCTPGHPVHLTCHPLNVYLWRHMKCLVCQ